jgi:hypothetical protein
LFSTTEMAGKECDFVLTFDKKSQEYSIRKLHATYILRNVRKTRAPLSTIAMHDPKIKTLPVTHKLQKRSAKSDDELSDLEHELLGDMM